MSGHDKLLDFINETVPQKLRIEEDFGHGYVRLNITEAQKRQSRDDIRCAEDVIVELLRNSRDANASKIYIASWKKENIRNIIIFDNGEGIPRGLVEKIFEARVTSKLNKVIVDQYGIHGRGMALYGIALHCSEAKVVLNGKEQPTAIRVVIDTNNLPEKANQSTWPRFNKKGDIVAGPNNLIRKSIEFNLKNPEIKIYMGSPTEIFTRLIEDGKFLNIESANSLHKKALKIGLDISFRNCQRIFHNEISLPQEILEIINVNKYSPKAKIRNVENPISKKDMDVLSEKTIDFANQEGEKYYLKVSEYASINKVGNTLKITLPLENAH